MQNCCLLNAQLEEGKRFVNNSDVFGTRNFIENKGQFTNPVGKEKILFVYDHLGEKISFTSKGLIYEFVKPPVQKKINPSEQEEEEEEEKEEKPLVKAHVLMNWLDANATVEVNSSDKQSHYFTYGYKEHNSSVFKKITYKNIYNNIDIEYSIPSDKTHGIKYNIILHPGAKVQDIRMNYSGAIKNMSILETGDLLVKTRLENIMERAPVSFYEDKTPVVSSYVLNKNIVSFSVATLPDDSRDLIIDPWITAITTLSNNNYGYDVDYDVNGNTFIYGGNVAGSARCKVAMYNSTGTLIWTFSGLLVSPAPVWNSGSTWSSNFKVHKLSGKSYVARNQGLPNVIRLDASGNYDNFIGPTTGNILEVWNMEINCNGDLIIYGGGATSGEIINTNTGVISLLTGFNPTVVNCCQDILSNAIDDAGNIFVYYSGHVALNNSLAQISPTFTNTIWLAPSGFNTFTYLQSKNFYVGASAGAAVAFNALAVNGNYLYYYDGSNLAAYNKTNGTLQGSVTIPGLSAKAQGGIAVDDCNHVYIGGNGSVLSYSFSGTTFSVLPSISLGSTLTNQYVYDVQLDRSSKVLHVTGSGFVGTYSAVSSLTCNSNYCTCMLPLITLNTASATCPNIGASTVNIVGIPGPYTYSWMPTSQTGSIATGLSPGTHTVAITSLSCNTSYTAETTFTAATTISLVISSTSITCANLGSATVVPFGILPPYTYTWMPTAQNSSVATGLSPGNYTVSVFSGGCNFNYTTTTYFNPLVPLTGNFSNSDSVFCFGAATGTGNITGIAGGSGSEFYFWGNGLNTYTTAYTNSLTAGIWSVSATDVLTGCKIFQTFYVWEPPPLVLQLTSNTPTNCVGTTIVLTGTNSGGTPFSSGSAYSYTWSGGPVADTHTVSETVGGVHVYTLSSSDANNCLTSGSISVDFIPNPILSVSNASICPLETATLTAGGASSYTWNSTFVGANFSASPLTNQQYTVIGTALSCTASATASVILKQVPLPFIQSNSPRCNGDNLTLFGFGGVSYNWFGPTNYTSVSQSNSIGQVALVNAGVYNLTVTAANNCSASTSATVVVNPTPTLSAAGSTVCTSQTLSLSAGAITGSSYQWSGPQNYNSTLQNPFMVNPSTNRTGNYIVKVTSADGCTNTAIAHASVVSPPLLNISLSSGSLCTHAFNGSPNSITLTSSGASTYTLITPSHISNSNPAGPSTTLSSIAPFMPGVTTLTLEGSNGICTSTTSSSFTVHQNPTVTVSSGSPAICANQSFTYTNTGATNYFWGPNVSGLSILNQGQQVVASPSVSSVYSVYGSSIGCNSETQNSTITVNALPIFSINPATPTICLAGKITLEALGTADTYMWYPYVGLNNVVGSTVTASPSTEQTYTVIGSLNSCTASAVITVSVFSLPIPTITVVKDKVCVNETITLQGAGGEGYSWFSPLGELAKNSLNNGQNVSFLAYSSGFNGTYSLLVTDKNGCKALTTTSIVVYGLPASNIQRVGSGPCVPFTSYFNWGSSSDSSSTIDIRWRLDTSTFYGKKFSFPFTKPGNYIITGFFTDTVTSCSNTGTLMVSAHQQPKADFEYNPEHPVEDVHEVIFTNTSEGELQQKWNWYFINNNGLKSEKETCFYTFKEAGIYPVALVVSDVWGCSDTVVKNITIDEDFNLFVPNAFTPNDDNLNDIFLPVMRGVKLYELSIFDRWGELMFVTTDPQHGWNGYYKGQICQSTVYTWKISLSTKSGQMKQLNGHITISR